MNHISQYVLSMQRSVPQTLAVLLLMIFAARGAGALLLRKTPYRGSFALETVAGMDLIALFTLFCGDALFQLPQCIFPGFAAILALWGLVQSRLPARKDVPVLILISAIGLYTLASALTAPYAWDEQVYQVALLTRYWQERSSGVFLDNPYSAFPSLPHFFLLGFWKLGGLHLARLSVWAGSLLLVRMLFLMLRRFGKAAAWTGGFCILLSPVAMVLNRDTYMEIFITLNFAAGIMILQNAKAGTAAKMLLAGLFAGAASAVKLTGGGVSIALFLYAFFCVRRTGEGKKLPLFFLAAAGIMFPFYWRSFAATGNFLYPFAGAILSPGSAAAAVESYHHKLGVYQYGLHGLPGWVFGWIFAAFHEKIYDGIVFGWQYPATLLLTLFFFFRARRHVRSILPAILMMLTVYTYWSFSSQQTRFLFPLYGMTVFFAAAVLGKMPEKYRTCGAAALLLCALVSFEPVMFKHYYYAWKFLKPALHSPLELLVAADRDPGHFAALEYLAKTPENSRVLLLFERRGLYVPRRYVIGTPCFQQKLFTPVPQSAENVLQQIDRERIDYVLIGASSQNPDYLSEYDPVNYQLSLHLRTLLRRGELTLCQVPGCGNYTILARKMR